MVWKQLLMVFGLFFVVFAGHPRAKTMFGDDARARLIRLALLVVGLVLFAAGFYFVAVAD